MFSVIYTRQSPDSLFNDTVPGQRDRHRLLPIRRGALRKIKQAQKIEISPSTHPSNEAPLQCFQ